MRKTIDLSGTYRFLLDPQKTGIDNHFENNHFTDTITLPSTTSASKKGPENLAKETGFLTDIHHYVGYAWFQRDIHIPEISEWEQAILTLERTRVSRVYIDNCFVGTQNSFCTSHHYDLTTYLTSGNHTLTIMVSNTGYPVRGGHMTSPDTQTNWNGILGSIQLDLYDSVVITSCHVLGSYEQKGADITGSFHSSTATSGYIRIYANCKHLSDGSCLTSKSSSELYEKLDIMSGDNSFHYRLSLGTDAKPWDEWDPNVYELCVSIETEEAFSLDHITRYFGLKDFKTDSTHFYINGTKTFLRGKHDGMIFPLTGYAPMDVDGWLKVMSTSRSFGINHYRFHTCCPPEAAFLAADLLGIYMEPELPFWGTFTKKGDDGHDEAGQNYLIEEGFRILDSYSDHPSFCMMSMGNELWGSPEALNELLGRYKEKYPHILFTQGSNNFQWIPNIQPNDDFFSGVRFTIDRQIRGSYAMCDKPQGHVQLDRPCTNFNYDQAIHPDYSSSKAQADADGMIEIQYGTGVKKVKLTDAEGELIPTVPVVSHEIGQYETFPDFKEIDQYTGVLRARNFEVFREALREKGLLYLADDYFKASGALAASCYKDELETALRTKDMAGFQILDIQDFSGQGTALVGMLNAFMENKGIISAENFRHFCNDCVIQAEFPTYIYQSGDTFHADIVVTKYTKNPLEFLTLESTFTFDGQEGETILNKSNQSIENGVTKISSLHYKIPDIKKPALLNLKIRIQGTDLQNEYSLWCYPSVCQNEKNNNIALFHSVKDLLSSMNTQKNCLLLLDDTHNPVSIEGTYCTDFWCYPMFCSISDSMKRERPVGTMGLLIQKEHPALLDFPSETYSTPQWWEIVMNSRSTILDDTSILPVVQTIDNFERNHRLGLIYEIHLADTDQNVLICTAPLDQLAEKGSIEASFLLNSLCNYLPSCKPEYSCSTDEFSALFTAK